MRRRVVGVGDELDRARAVVARGLRQRDGLLAQRRAAAPSETTGDGDSSITFWWRRWSEHSRSPSEITLPCVSPITCTSMCRARGRKRSRNTRSSPKPACASRCAAAIAVFQVLGALDDAHPAPAAARRRLDQHGVLDRLRRVRRDGAARRAARPPPPSPAPCRPSARSPPATARRTRRPPRRTRAPAPGSRTGSRSRGAARRRRTRHDLVDRQVRGDAHRRVGLAHVRRARVDVRVDRDRADAEPRAACGSRGARSPPGWRRGRSRTFRRRARGRSPSAAPRRCPRRW